MTYPDAGAGVDPRAAPAYPATRPPATAKSRSAAPAGRVAPAGRNAPARPGVAAARRARRVNTRRQALAEWVVAIGMAVLAAFAIKTWVVQAFKIPSESMLPTLAVGDRVLVRKAGFDLGDLDHGDVVVFRNQRPLPGEPEYLIKRVIGLPGDRLEARDGRLLRNDKPLEEPYVVAGSATRNLAATTVADGEVFVLGDNREDSADSREKGPVPEANLVGEAVALIWPIGRVSGL